jgi:hypothetical protein
MWDLALEFAAVIGWWVHCWASRLAVFTILQLTSQCMYNLYSLWRFRCNSIQTTLRLSCNFFLHILALCKLLYIFSILVSNGILVSTPAVTACRYMLSQIRYSPPSDFTLRITPRQLVSSLGIYCIIDTLYLQPRPSHSHVYALLSSPRQIQSRFLPAPVPCRSERTLYRSSYDQTSSACLFPLFIR